MTKDDAVRKVAALLALAIDQAGTPEGDLARQRAEEIRARFAVSEADLAAGEEEPMAELRLNVPQAMWRRRIYLCVAKLAGAFAVFTVGSPIIRLFGRPQDVEICCYLARTVFGRCGRELESWTRRCEELTRSPDRKERNAWRRAFSAGVQVKVEDLLRRAEPDEPGLVLARDAKTWGLAALSAEGTKVGKSKESGAFDPDGYRSGYATEFRAGLSTSAPSRQLKGVTR